MEFLPSLSSCFDFLGFKQDGDDFGANVDAEFVQWWQLFCVGFQDFGDPGLDVVVSGDAVVFVDFADECGLFGCGLGALYLVAPVVWAEVWVIHRFYLLIHRLLITDTTAVPGDSLALALTYS